MAPQPTGSRKTQEERRNLSESRLLTAAAELLVEEGFAATTFAAIARRAGYSHGLVTQRFGSRDGLMAALIEFLGDRMEHVYEAILKKARRPLEELAAFVCAFFKQMDQDKLAEAYFVMLAAAVGNRLEQRTHFFDCHQRVISRLAEIIRRGQRDGSISSAYDPIATATAIGCIQAGVAIQLLINPDLDIERTGTAILQGLTKSLSGSSEPSGRARLAVR